MNGRHASTLPTTPEGLTSGRGAAAAGPPFDRALALHSLGWLTAANLVGLWLATSLLWPEAGNLLAPLTYGRWSALHLDWQLYGWCALPVVGALLAWFVDPAHLRATLHAKLALWSWTAALVGGGVAWLGGAVSGKLFLEWHGWTRPLLPLAMLVLWVVLALHLRAQWREVAGAGRWLRAGLLALLLPVPGVIVFATSRSVYHPINPDSGGATAAAVLGSTLGIVTIFFLVPVMLGVQPARRIRGFLWLLGGSWLVFAVLDRGNVSHHGLVPVLSLALLLGWIPLLPLYWRRHDWPAAARPWLRAAAWWWAALVATGWMTFLPGVSEVLKFTHSLVGHAHLAMAGLLTSVNAVILVVLRRRAAPRGVFAGWQTGCAVYVVAMMILGFAEIEHVDALFRSEGWTQALLGMRLLGGLFMAAASGRWLLAEVRR
jgi:cytochrome c oxidase cbb3-type subunit I